MEQQQEAMEKALKREVDKHREKTSILERHSLETKHQLLRGNCTICLDYLIIECASLCQSDLRLRS